MKIVADANIPHVVECFSTIGEVHTLSGREINKNVVADADILLVRSITPVFADLLTGSNVRYVATATIGFDHIDVDFLRHNSIGFASAPGSNANSAAEYVIAALLEIAQKHNITLEGKSIGVVGVGNVGSKVAKKCKALGMKVLLNDPPLYRQTDDPKYLQLQDLYNCDFITFHTPLTFDGIDKTFHLADESFFKSLKKGCVFINASRGAVADSKALEESINTKRLKAVALDVWENEPKIDMKLLEKVDIGSPHIAGYSLDGKIAGLIMIYKSICEFFSIEPEHDIHDFLPEPEVKKIEIKDESKSDQEILQDVISQVYSIKRDDENLRQISIEPAENIGIFFDQLRKNYPIRREFQNTKVILKDINSSLAKKLHGIGFKVVTSDK
ncbi:MAG: 4-phosphoerythronate dehydrogenase PdxB [Sedimentisphaerales bacterium]|nr:4-phosphoerythronate dehydrogenase PdxB [Sedimentisphaerales bacterium]